VRIVDRSDGELRAGRQRQADADQALLDEKLIGARFGGRRRDVVGRAGGAVDQAEDRIVAAACGKALGDTLRADTPAVLRLMAGEARSAVGAEILEERVVEGERRAAGLESGYCAARIRIEAEAQNDRRRLLGAMIPIGELPHLLHV